MPFVDDADVVALPLTQSAASDDNTHCWALYNCSSACYDTETPQNNYIGLRTITGGDQVVPANSRQFRQAEKLAGFAIQLYVEYQTGNLDQAAIEFDKVDYIELYEFASDPWQQKNLVNATSAAIKAQLHEELHKFYQCSGATCP